MATVEHCLYCFETLEAELQDRTPLTLAQVQQYWADYPKGLEEDVSTEPAELLTDDLIPPPPASSKNNPFEGAKVKYNKNGFRDQTVARLSGTSTPNSGSSSNTPDSLDANDSTAQTTPASSTPSFSPIGMSPKKSSQRAGTITESPLFVTWNTVDNSKSDERHRMLRGCIGTFETLPIATGLASYAITAGLHDHRFNPISIRELPELEVSVTLLTDFEEAKDAMDWELGVHGIRISFMSKNRRYGACYLPEVAPEQGWDKEETIVSLIRKSGWGGRKNGWREVGDFHLTRFQGYVESVPFEEFDKFRTWVNKEKARKS